MNQSVKIAAAGCVLLGGVAAAMMFRHESPRPAAAAGVAGDQLMLRNQADPAFARPLSPGTYPSPIASPETSPPAPRRVNRNVTILTPMDPGAPPPVFEKDYPDPGGSGTSRWGTAIRPAFPNAARADDGQRTHKIVDGDTLQSLAARYLGSEDRCLEIYEANRELLSSPEVLPIGSVLKIPPRQPVARPSVDDVLPGGSEPDDPLVSIPEVGD